MGKIFLTFDHDIPQYAYTGCSQCTSVEGISLCEIKNRGCCWYFPKFNLVDILRMSKSDEGLQILDRIKQNPKTIVYNYYIHTRGYFDRTGYEKYTKSNQRSDEDIFNDHTIFFRACPFVKPGYGCTLPPRYRTTVCNFFICNKITNDASKHEEFKRYLTERSRYSRWVHWENTSLEYLLREKGLNLIDNFEGSIEFLRNTSLNTYEFPFLKPIEISL